MREADAFVAEVGDDVGDVLGERWDLAVHEVPPAGTPVARHGRRRGVDERGELGDAGLRGLLQEVDTGASSQRSSAGDSLGDRPDDCLRARISHAIGVDVQTVARGFQDGCERI